MEFIKKIYHSRVFGDCIQYFSNVGTNSIKKELAFGEKFLYPIEMFLSDNNQQIESRTIINKIKESLENCEEYSSLRIYGKVKRKIESYIKNNKFSRKPLEYYSWTLDVLINHISKSHEWNILIKNIDNQVFNDYQVFLSYSSIDKALTYWMYQYFNERNVFLYVDWMFGKYYDSGTDSKNKLEAELRKSRKFVYLRTLNSEVSGGKYTRSWCGWEIGRSYQYHNNNQYHCDEFAVGPIAHPSIIDGFYEFTGLSANGEF